jgi:signal transduction histidine kinase
MTRRWPTLLGLMAAAILASYVINNQILVREMRRESVVHTRIVADVIAGLNDPREEAPLQTLWRLSGTIQELDFPVVYEDAEGVPSSVANLPFQADLSKPADVARVRAYARTLASRNAPIVEPALGTFYFGDTPTIRRLRWIPWLQVGALAGILVAAFWMVRHNARTERERIWASLARESAHQMATPLSSLSGWVEILRLPEDDRETMATLPAVAAEMEADLDRLEKVAHRFEWIGRPVQKEAVDLRTLLRVLERYVRVRLPQLGRSVELEMDVPEGTPPVQGNAVLLEWALENLVKNALDALAGSGGHIRVEAEASGEKRVAVRVVDDGPGVASAMRGRIFLPGVTTKRGGWGVGLSLTRRIVEDVHGGTLRLLSTERGATFELRLPAAPRAEAPESARGLGTPRERTWLVSRGPAEKINE